MLTLPIHNEFTRVRRSNSRWEWVISVLTILNSVSRVFSLLKLIRPLAKELEAVTCEQRDETVMISKGLIERAAQISDSNEVDSFIEDINWFIAYHSKRRVTLERLLATNGGLFNKNFSHALDANEESLVALYDTLRLLKKLKPKTAQPTSEIAKEAVSRTSNTLRSLYAR